MSPTKLLEHTKKYELSYDSSENWLDLKLGQRLTQEFLAYECDMKLPDLNKLFVEFENAEDP